MDYLFDGKCKKTTFGQFLKIQNSFFMKKCDEQLNYSSIDFPELSQDNNQSHLLFIRDFRFNEEF